MKTTTTSDSKQTEQNPEQEKTFRDSVGTIDDKGKRVWIHPKQPHGRLYRWRTAASLIFLAVLFSLPFIHVNDHPLFLFNVTERKFIFFGAVFWPQDFFLFVLGMLTFMLFIIVFTVAFGRIFCGWACPQTIFLELVFRRIEYWIEGDAAAQRKLKTGPWNREKFVKRGIKHSIFFLISFIIANTFLAYIIGQRQLFHIMSEPVQNHLGGFISLLIFTGVFYFIFSWFREQACLVVCPYGRMQGVLLDRNSIVVAYDYKRGEPRGHIKHGEENKFGDCIDCKLCVKVCPTGIDIRNGTQLECVNCTACIDECDTVMEKVHKPKGLIRYASENNIALKQKTRFTFRMAAYSFVLLVLSSVLVFLMATRKDIRTTLLRAPGVIFQRMDDGRIGNLYKIKLANKTYHQLPIELKVEEAGAEIKMVGDTIMLPQESVTERLFFVTYDSTKVHKRSNNVHIDVYTGKRQLERISITFLGPAHHHHNDSAKPVKSTTP